MKKISLLLVALMATISAMRAGEKVGFGFDAGAEVVSDYLWRGMYNGGLSVQPDLAVGFDSKYTSLRVGTWWNIGASDWQFANIKDAYRAGFAPEMDIHLDLNLYGLTLGGTHYYYFGKKFFNFRGEEKDGAQTEVYAGYDFSTLLDFGLNITWYTLIAGSDHDEEGKRAYSSYLEVVYTHEFKYGMSLTGAVGVTPWKSYYTDYEGGFACNNISLRFEKEWDLAICSLSVFAQGMLNTYDLNKDNVFIKSISGEKTNQKLNGCIGMGVWF